MPVTIEQKEEVKDSQSDSLQEIQQLESPQNDEQLIEKIDLIVEIKDCASSPIIEPSETPQTEPQEVISEMQEEIKLMKYSRSPSAEEDKYFKMADEKL